MEPFSVVEQFDVPENSFSHVSDVLEVSPIDSFFLEAGEEVFHACVVVGTVQSTHRRRHPVLREHRAVAPFLTVARQVVFLAALVYPPADRIWPYSEFLGYLVC